MSTTQAGSKPAGSQREGFPRWSETYPQGGSEGGNSEFSERYRQALSELLMQLADDDIAFGHRSAEWLGLAPDLEEDIAFSSIAQDEVGHAAFYYGLLAELVGETADSLAFARPSHERRNSRLLEQPNGDWAYTVVRAFFYNVFEQLRLERLQHSSYAPLRLGAVKILREERYHRLHVETWFDWLAAVDGEARHRLEAAIVSVWHDLPDLFSLGEVGTALIDEGILPSGDDDIFAVWQQIVKPLFERRGLPWPVEHGQREDLEAIRDGRVGAHTAHLDELLCTMTEVYESDVDAKW